MVERRKSIHVQGAFEHNLKGIDIEIPHGKITVITGVSGSGKSSLAFDTVLAEANRRFFYTLSHYSRQFLDLGSRPAVRKISGLSPAIALAQNETLPTRRSTVGTLSDVTELLGVCFARFGDKLCPKHQLPTTSQSLQEMTTRLCRDFAGENIAICAPIATQKKGNFATRLQKLANQGYVRAYVDGETVELHTPPTLAKEEKHTIKIFVDVVKASEKNLARLEESLQSAFKVSEGYAEAFVSKPGFSIDEAKGVIFSLAGGCPKCGYSWPHLEARYFSANSLGKCQTCSGYGTVNEFEDDEYSYEFEYQDVEDLGRLDSADLSCPTCDGTGIDPKFRAIRIEGISALDCQKMTVKELLEWTSRVKQVGKAKENLAFNRVAQQICDNLGRISDVGLPYLMLKRRVRSLSAGELQRLKLAGILGDHLRGVLYVLDEPSQGLHPSEIDTLCEGLERLRKVGNTLIIVDHDETLMRRADLIIDLGPGGGAQGGQLMATFAPKDAASFEKYSLTASHLAHEKVMQTSSTHRSGTTSNRIRLLAPSLNNLCLSEVEFIAGAMNVVTGVSGAGKSSLVLGVLGENVQTWCEHRLAAKKKKPNTKAFRVRFCQRIEGLEAIDRVEIINRKPIAKSSVSMPATYLDVFGYLRELYGKMPEAQIAGLDASSFSLAREGGRCEHCGGRGEENLQMRFLADARIRCEHCEGMRYRPHVLNVKFSGLSLAEVLRLTIQETFDHFSAHKQVQRLLQPALALGLGYLKLGQPSSSLSGGEAQRLKMVPFLVKKHNVGTMVILDEPTTGLHFEDVEKLLNQLQLLVSNGATVVMIEHNLDVIKSADWVIDLGPGSAAQGGNLVYAGVPEKLHLVKESITALALTPPNHARTPTKATAKTGHAN